MALTDLFSNIADAIREKDGTTAEITANDFPDRIRAIPTDIGGVRLESISITAPPLKTNYYAGDTFDPTGMVVYANYSNGQSMYVNHSNLTFEPSGALPSGTTSVTVNFQWGIKMASASQTISVVTVMCFGVVWDYSNPSPELTRLTPETDPNGYVTATVTTEPSPAIGTGPGSSPFDSYSPWKNMKKYNLVYSNNLWSSYSEDSLNFSYDNETAVYIPNFWYDVIDDPVNNKRYWYVADKAYKQMEIHPGGNKFLARYKCGTEARSITGLNRDSEKFFNDALSACANKGSRFHISTMVVWCAVRLLYLIEYASWDSQIKIGEGVYGNSTAVYSFSGLTDVMNYHTGKVNDDESPQIQYRGIEGAWGNSIEMTDGIVSTSGSIYLTNDNIKGEIIHTYDHTFNRLMVVQSLLYLEQYKWLFLPDMISEVGASDSSYTTDSCSLSILDSNENGGVGGHFPCRRLGGLFASYFSRGGSINYGYRYVYDSSL